MDSGAERTVEQMEDLSVSQVMDSVEVGHSTPPERTARAEEILATPVATAAKNQGQCGSCCHGPLAPGSRGLGTRSRP